MPVIRPLQPDDLPRLRDLWHGTPWRERADELYAIASAAVASRAAEHRALCAVERPEGADGVVLYRKVAGAIGTGEIECVAARAHRLADALLRAAVAELWNDGARLVVAEHPGTEEYHGYEELLESAGFRLQATIGDYIAEGVPLLIRVRKPGLTGANAAPYAV